MLGGFDPRSEKLFFQRRLRSAWLISLALYGGAIIYGVSRGPAEETVEVQLEPELQDFAVEEEKEPEVEEEPPPPPPPNAKIDVNKKPQKKKKIEPPKTKQTDAAPETTQEKTYGPGAGASDGMGNKQPETPRKTAPKADPPKPKVDPPKPKKQVEVIDPTQPVDRPEKATMPKPDSGNKAPDFPEALREAGITGHVRLKIHIHRDGSVRGAKILVKRSSATTEEEKADAEKKFIAAAIAAVKTWKYEPAKLEGEPISIWFPVDFPFQLTGG